MPRGASSVSAPALTHPPPSESPSLRLLRGINLLEVFLGLVLLGIGASLAIPAWFGRSEVTLDNAARLLATDLRKAQNRAAFRRLGTQVEFAESGVAYRVMDETGLPAPAPIGDGPFERVYERDAVFRGVRVAEVDFDGGRVLRYDRRGAAQSGGRIVLEFGDSDRQVTLSVRKGAGWIQVDGLSEPWVDLGL